MCLGAMIQARIKNLVFGAWDPRAGAVHSVFQILDAPQLNHRIDWQGGILADRIRRPPKKFFPTTPPKTVEFDSYLCQGI